MFRKMSLVVLATMLFSFTFAQAQDSGLIAADGSLENRSEFADQGADGRTLYMTARTSLYSLRMNVTASRRDLFLLL